MRTPAIHLTETEIAELKQAEQRATPMYRPVELKVNTHEDWTVSDLAVMVERWYGVVYEAEESYVRLLKESRFSYQRSTKAYRHQSSTAALLEIEAGLEKSDRLSTRPS